MLKNSPEKKFWAFISYSSKDKKWGQWLHKRLENYSIPKEFQGIKISKELTLGKHIRPIFRDRDELSGSADLGPAILTALKGSHNLIVLCSPNSAKSEWVNKEIEDFKQLGREKNILALILDGVPNASTNKAFDSGLECFPPALRYPAEPLAGDLRKEGDGKHRGFLKVLSGIAQLDFDHIYRRHERMQRNKRIIGGGLAAVIILALSGLSWFAFEQKKHAEAQTRIAEKARNETRVELAGSLLFQGQAAISGSAFREALTPLLRAVDLYGEMKQRPPELVRLLRVAVDGNDVIHDFRAHDERVSISQFSSDGDVLLTSTGSYGDVALWDTKRWKARFTKKLDGLRYVVLSEDAGSVITVQEEKDEQSEKAITSWKRWSSLDGSLMESTTLENFSVHEMSLEYPDTDGIPNFYPVYNHYSKKENEPLILNFHSIQSNEKLATFSLPPTPWLNSSRYFPEAGFLVVETDESVRLIDASGDTSSQELKGAVKYMKGWYVTEDGKRIFAMDRSNKGRWFVWDRVNGELIHEAAGEVNLAKDIDGLRFSDDAKFIALMKEFGFPVRKVDLGYWRQGSSGKLKASLASEIVAIGSYTQTEVHFLSSRQRTGFKVGNRDCSRIELHPGRRFLVSFDKIGRAIVFDIGGDERSPVDSMKLKGLSLLEISKDGKQCLFRTAEKDLIIWDLSEELIISRIEGADDADAFKYEWLPDAGRLLTRSGPVAKPLEPTPQTIRVFDTSNGAQLLELKKSYALKLSPEGKTLLAHDGKGHMLHPVGRDGDTVMLFDLSEKDDELGGQDGFSADGKLIARASASGKVVIQDVMTGNVIKKVDLGRPVGNGWDEHSFSQIFFHTSNTGLLVASNFGRSYMIDLPSGKVVAHPQFQMDHGGYFNFWNDGSTLSKGYSHDSVGIWKFPELELINKIECNSDHYTIFTTESRFLSAARYGDTIFGDLKSGLEIHTYKEPLTTSSENGLVAVEDDLQIKIFNFRTNKLVKAVASANVSSGMFSPDGKFLYIIDRKGCLSKLQVRLSFEEILTKAKLEALKDDGK